VLLDRVQPGPLLAATLAATAAAFFALFTSSSLTTALPAAVAVGTFGSMSLVVPQTVMQRVIPNALLGRIAAVFLTGEAAATLAGAAAGPVLAQAAGLTATAVIASLVTLAAAVLARLSIPKTTVPQRHDPVALALSIGGQYRSRPSRTDRLRSPPGGPIRLPPALGRHQRPGEEGLAGRGLRGNRVR
jgi:predicted MFS family arabinose efflux permease